MLEKILRSPFIMMSMLVMVGIVLVGGNEGWPLMLYYIPFLAVIILYFSLLFYHNQRYPNQRIKVLTLVPYELREDDEGLQYITFKAMRKVYIFYTIAIPISILLVVLLQTVIPYFTIWLLIALGCIQLLLYWLEIRKAFTEEDEM